jgi:hypothetical protein
MSIFFEFGSNSNVIPHWCAVMSHEQHPSVADELTQITREVKELRARQQASSRTFTSHKYTSLSQSENPPPEPLYPPAIPPSPIIPQDDDTPPMQFVLQPDPTPSHSTSTSHTPSSQSTSPSHSASTSTPASHSSSSPGASIFSFSRSRLGLPHSSSKGTYLLDCNQFLNSF